MHSSTALSSFDELVAQHRRSVFLVCRSILRDEHLGADATQETFLRLWKRLVEGRAPESFGAWLRRVAVTTSLDYLRRGQVAQQTSSEDVAGPAHEEPTGIAAAHEVEERLEAALRRLPHGQRTVFLLRHGGGMTLAQVAESLGLALPTVKTHFARACLKLQSALAPFDDRRP